MTQFNQALTPPTTDIFMSWADTAQLLAAAIAEYPHAVILVEDLMTASEDQTLTEHLQELIRTGLITYNREFIFPITALVRDIEVAVEQGTFTEDGALVMGLFRALIFEGAVMLAAADAGINNRMPLKSWSSLYACYETELNKLSGVLDANSAQILTQAIAVAHAQE